MKISVIEIVNHPEYQATTEQDKDFSLLKLASAVDFSSLPHIHPICLPVDDSKDYSGYVATVTGLIDIFGILAKQRPPPYIPLLCI